MTPARASHLRGLRVNQKELSNTEQREAELRKKEKRANRWTINPKFAIEIPVRISSNKKGVFIS